MFCIGDVVYYKASKGARKERCKVIGVENHDKSFKYILEKKYDESIIENATIYQMSYY